MQIISLVLQVQLISFKCVSATFATNIRLNGYINCVVVLLVPVGSRSVFTSAKPDVANPNWLRVGLAFGTSAFLWGLVNQHIIIIIFE